MPDRTNLSIEERRAKRAERREKQRVANIGRSEKMHAARIAFESASAEANHRGDSTSSASLRPTKIRQTKSADELRVGCSGWFYWHWRGIFYKDNLPTNEWFAHYAKNFDTVELNAPFYAWPTVGTVNTWKKQPGRRKFVYAVKVCELITHIKRFKGTKTLVKDFGHIADLLGERFGCFLFQLPPSFRYTPARLKAITDQLDSTRRNVVEFRHKSWWNEKVYASFREKGITFCSTSGPRLPDELVTTADEVYIRFHGTKQWYRHDYSPEELRVWAERIRTSGAKRVFAYFNNDRDGNAIKNATSLLRLLK